MSRRNTLSGAGTVRLVARREARERLRAKSFWILTGILVVVVLAIAVVARVAGHSEAAIRVGVVTVPPGTGRSVPGPSPTALAASLDAEARRLGMEVAVQDGLDRGVARRALRDGRIDAVLDPARGAVTFDGTVDADGLQLLQAAWAGAVMRSSLAADGLDAASIERAMTPAPLHTVVVDDDEIPRIAQIVGVVSAVVLFIALQMFGSYVLMGVVEEKSTGVIEVLLARAPPTRLLAGKVIGIGVCAAVQMVAGVAAGLAALAISGHSVPSELWSAVPMLIVWFVGGYALYSTLFALAGSLVSRQEDAQAASAPIMAVLVAAYVTVFTFGFDPTSTASRVLSILPPTSPLLMPMRMASGAASPVEVGLALVLLAAAVVAAWRLTGRVYGAVVLQRGTRIRWSEALGSGRAHR